MTSNVSEVYVHQDIDPGDISDSQVICYDSLASTLNMTEFPTGGGDISYTYQWQYSFNNSLWFNIDLSLIHI